MHELINLFPFSYLAGNNIDVVVGSEKDGKYLVGKYRPPNFQIHSPLSDVNYLNCRNYSV